METLGSERLEQEKFVWMIVMEALSHDSRDGGTWPLSHFILAKD